MGKTEGKTGGRRDRTTLMQRKQQTSRYIGYTTHICINVTNRWAVNINFCNYIFPRNYKLTSARTTQNEHTDFICDGAVDTGEFLGVNGTSNIPKNDIEMQQFLYIALRRQFQIIFWVQEYKYNLQRHLLNFTAYLLNFSVLATYIRIFTYLMLLHTPRFTVQKRRTMHGASFLNRARNSHCTVITDLDTSKRSTQKAFSCCDAIL